MLTSFVLYIKGLKHNHTVFFLQTLSLLAFPSSNLELSKVLYGLHYSYYGFKTPLAIFITKTHFEESPGNFGVLTLDSNLLRVAGATLIISILTGCLSAALRILSARRPECLRERIRIYKKTGYRSVEFFYKTCMYPLVFFAMVTISNWTAQMMSGSNSNASLGSRLIAVLVLCAYTATTIYSLWFEQIAKVNKL